MVSSQDALRLSYEKLRRTSVSVLAYTGAVHDVVFEMVTADTFIAGVADRIVSGQRPLEDHR